MNQVGLGLRRAIFANDHNFKGIGAACRPEGFAHHHEDQVTGAHCPFFD